MTEPRPVTVTVKNSSYLNRSWPPSSVGIVLSIVAGNMIAYPLWWLVLAKYREERDSLVRMGQESSILVSILDALSHSVLETAPRLVAGSFLLYVGLCAGYVGLATLRE